MSALTADRTLDTARGAVFGYPVGGAETIYLNAMVCVYTTDGYLYAASDSSSMVFAGIAQERADNSAGSSGDVECPVLREGIFLMTIGDSWAQTAVGTKVYVADDQTVDSVGAVSNNVFVGVTVGRVSATKFYVDITTATKQTDVATHLSDTIDAHDASAISVVDSGSHYSASTSDLEVVLAAAGQHIRSAQHFIPIPLTSLREVASNQIAQTYDTIVKDIPLESLRQTDATNILASAAHYGVMGPTATGAVLDLKNGDTDSNLYLKWVATNVEEVIFKVDLDDIDTSSAITVTVRAALDAHANTPVINLDTYFNEGDTKVEDATGAITSTGVAEYTATIAAADVPSGARTMTCELTPAAHADDDIYVYQIRVSYKAVTENAHKGLLGASTTPILQMTNADTDSCLRLNWAISNRDAVIFQTPLPPNLDTTKNLVLHVLGAVSGNTDNPVLDLDTYFNVGDTKVEDATSAVNSTTAREHTATIAAADVPEGALTMTCEITPAAHTTDSLYIYAIWLEYSGTLLTS